MNSTHHCRDVRVGARFAGLADELVQAIGGVRFAETALTVGIRHEPLMHKGAVGDRAEIGEPFDKVLDGQPDIPRKSAPG